MIEAALKLKVSIYKTKESRCHSNASGGLLISKFQLVLVRAVRAIRREPYLQLRPETHGPNVMDRGITILMNIMFPVHGLSQDEP